MIIPFYLQYYKTILLTTDAMKKQIYTQNNQYARITFLQYRNERFPWHNPPPRNGQNNGSQSYKGRQLV